MLCLNLEDSLYCLELGGGLGERDVPVASVAGQHMGERCTYVLKDTRRHIIMGQFISAVPRFDKGALS